MLYDDFVLQLEARPGGGHRVRVTRSPAGEGSEEVDLGRAFGQWIDLASPHPGARRGRATAGTSRGLTPDEEPPDAFASDPREVGSLLFEELIRGQVRSLFDQSLGALRHQPDRGLRIKLKLDPQLPELARLSELPWELLYRRETHDFLALSRATPLVRYLEVSRPTLPIPLPAELSILVAISSPRDLPALNLAKELEKLDEIWKHQRQLKTRLLEHPSSSSLRAALLEAPCHVLHFMGHGDFDPATGDGLLFLETEDQLSEAITGRGLATKLKDVHELGLVFLNACNTAAASAEGASPFGGVASALVLGGVPAVLAMQRPISDRAAIRFSQAFYRRLAAGDPVDTAVTEGRQAIDTGDSLAREWAIPALFVRVHDGTVFSGAPGKGPQAPQAAAAPLPVLSRFPIEEEPKSSGMARKVAGGIAAAALVVTLALVTQQLSQPAGPVSPTVEGPKGDGGTEPVPKPEPDLPKPEPIKPAQPTNSGSTRQIPSKPAPTTAPESTAIETTAKQEPPAAPVADPRNLQGQLLSVHQSMDGSLRASVAFSNSGEVPLTVTISSGTSYLTDNKGNRYDIAWSNLQESGGG